MGSGGHENTQTTAPKLALDSGKPVANAPAQTRGHLADREVFMPVKKKGTPAAKSKEWRERNRKRVIAYRKSILPTDAAERKKIPIATGVMDYFPAAFVEIAKLSYKGNEQHNPGQPLHWSRGKSNDHKDTMQRHFIESGTIDVDGIRHSAKMAWRALAILQLELEEAGAPLARGAIV